jgi:hypothetical protein
VILPAWLTWGSPHPWPSGSVWILAGDSEEGLAFVAPLLDPGRACSGTPGVF